MTEFSVNIIRCLEDWSSAAAKCNGNSNCLEECTQHLRNCLDNVIPPSNSIELEADKVNYVPFIRLLFGKQTSKMYYRFIKA